VFGIDREIHARTVPSRALGIRQSRPNTHDRASDFPLILTAILF
jgi:hypothetical protein